MPCASNCRCKAGAGTPVNEQVVIGLGGNLGDPFRTMISAFQDLAPLASGKLVISNIYRSEPVGLAGNAADFANAVASFECELEPMVLLQKLKALESKYGRTSVGGRGTADLGERYESRVLDLDIISFGDRLILEHDLKIPHPRAFERLFVLLPLIEIAPGFRFADRKESLQQLVDVAPRMRVVPWGRVK